MGTPARRPTRGARNKNVGDGKPNIDAGNDVFDVDNPTGKPPGDSGAAALPSGSTVDPASVGRPGGTDNGSDNSAAASGDRPKRKYTRRAARSADPLSVDEISGWKDIALSTHAMLHSLTQNPLFDIDENDAEKITRLASNVARHYENIPGISPKTKDWIMLIQGAGVIYGPRFAVWQMQRAERRKSATLPPRSPHAPANVAPAPTAANADIRQRTVPPANNLSPQGMRQQPGIAELDGAEKALKIN